MPFSQAGHRVVAASFSYTPQGAKTCNVWQPLPPEIGQLIALESISIESKWLTEIPPEIGHLTNLEEFVLRGEITSLPPEIWQLEDSGTKVWVMGTRRP